MWHLTTILFSTLLLSCALAAQDEAVPSCGADVTINSAYYGHGSFVYNDIMVLNTGACAITQLFVQLTLPPGAEAFAYHNISNQTGELLGLVTPVKVGSMQKGGSVVLNSIRTPLVSVASIICESTCDKGSNTVAPASAASVRRSKPATPSQGSSITIKVETEWGANSRWIALSLLDDIATSEVWLTSAKGSRQLMKREQWTTKTAYTFSSGVAMELPISLELKSFYGETIVLKNFITSFEYTVADTDDSYASSPVVDVIDHSLRLVIHPASNSEWIGLTPYGTLASRVSSVAVRAANAEFVTMTRADVGFYTVSSPDQAITVPVFAQVTFDDGTSLQVDVVDF